STRTANTSTRPERTMNPSSGPSSRNGVFPPTTRSSPSSAVRSDDSETDVIISALDQFGVRSRNGLHFLVRAALHHPAVFEHDDFVRIANRAEAVRHDEAGAAAA